MSDMGESGMGGMENVVEAEFHEVDEIPPGETRIVIQEAPKPPQLPQPVDDSPTAPLEVPKDPTIPPDAREGSEENGVSGAQPVETQEADAQLTPAELQDELDQIEENADQPFAERVKLYQQETLKLVGGEDVSVREFLQLGAEGDVRFLALRTQTEQAFGEYQNLLQQGLEGTSGDQAKQKAAELVSQFTGTAVAPEQLTFVNESGQVDPESFQNFLAENTSVTHLVETFVKLHDGLKQETKEQKAVDAEVGRATSLIQADQTLSPDEKEQALQEYRSLQTMIAKGLDDVNVPGVINLVFAVEHGYGSYGRFDAYHNGLERKNDLREQTTLAALQQVFADEEKRTTFFREILGIDGETQLSYSEVQPRLKSLLEVDNEASDEEKQRRIGEIKKKVFEGFEKVGRTGLISSINSPEDVNLSPTVIQSLVKEGEKFT